MQEIASWSSLQSNAEEFSSHRLPGAMVVIQLPNIIISLIQSMHMFHLGTQNNSNGIMHV